MLRGSFGRLKASSIYGFGWVGAVPQPLDESSKLQKRVVFLCFCQQKIDRNHLKFWVSQVRVLYNISDFLLKPPPKQGNNNMGSVTIFYFFPLVDFPKMSFFFACAKSGGFWWLFFYGMGRRRIQSCVATCRGPKMPPLMADCYEGKVGFSTKVFMNTSR